MLLCFAGLGFAGLGPADAGATSVYVPSFNEGTVFQYGVGAGGLLSALSPPTVPLNLGGWGAAVSPDGKSVYVASKGKEVWQYDVGPAGVLSPKSPEFVAAQNAPLGVAISPDGTSVYVTNQLSDTISQYDVGAGGALTPKTPATVATGKHPNGIAVSPDGRSVYVADGASEDVAQYDVGAGGVLTPKSAKPVPAGEEAWGIAVSPDGGSLYVAAYGPDSVFQYDIGAGGVLSAKSPASVPAGEGAIAVAISPDGGSLYVANDTAPAAEAISQYDVRSGGLLAPKAPAFAAAPAFGAEGIAITPDGRNLYLAEEGAPLLAQYDVGPGGMLSAKSPPSVTAGSKATGVVATPDQGPSASFTSTPAPAGSPSAFDGAAATDADGTVSSYRWSFGDGSTAGGVAPTHIYASPGTYTVTLQVTDDAGCSAAEVFTGQSAYCNASAHGIAGALVTVPPAPIVIAAPIVPAAPKITGAGQSSSRWREGNRMVQISRRRPPVGTTFSFSLNEFATASFRFTHQLGGRRVGRRCLAQTKRNRHRRACRRTVTAATMSFPAHTGRNKVAFQGRVTRSRRLEPGRYTLIITATNSAGARSNQVSLGFTIVP